MSGSDLWKKYCSFYEKPFSEQLERNQQQLDEYFEKWKKTDLAKMLCKETPRSYKDVPPTTYSDYPMMTEFAQKITEVTEKTQRGTEEPLADYYLRVGRQAGATLDRYMVEPFYYCAKTTGTTGTSKWTANGETFYRNLGSTTIAASLVACSDEWGETKINEGDTALNITAPIPYASGWGILASQACFNLLPPIKVTDNLEDMKKKIYLVLNLIGKGEKIDVGGSAGSIFYMICKYFVNPEEFYQEYYNAMSLGMKKFLLGLNLLRYKLSSKQKKNITDFIPLKGAIISGVDARLYIDFFREEFNLVPLHLYGATEVGILMKGDPDRKTDLVPDISMNYLEFLSNDGRVISLNEVEKDRVYEAIATPFGSILYRYLTGDLFRVVDFRDDGMPVFAFEGRKQNILEIYGYYRMTPHIAVKALSKAGLQASDKWAVTKILEPQEHLCFAMEKAWAYSEKEAEKIIFEALQDTSDDFKKYVSNFDVKNPSDAIKVEYLKKGAFIRYSANKAKMGVPLGQYKPPQVIPTDRMEIYETLKGI